MSDKPFRDYKIISTHDPKPLPYGVPLETPEPRTIPMVCCCCRQTVLVSSSHHRQCVRYNIKTTTCDKCEEKTQGVDNRLRKEYVRKPTKTK